MYFRDFKDFTEQDSLIINDWQGLNHFLSKHMHYSITQRNTKNFSVRNIYHEQYQIQEDKRFSITESPMKN